MTLLSYPVRKPIAFVLSRTCSRFSVIAPWITLGVRGEREGGREGGREGRRVYDTKTHSDVRKNCKLCWRFSNSLCRLYWAISWKHPIHKYKFLAHFSFVPTHYINPTHAGRYYRLQEYFLHIYSYTHKKHGIYVLCMLLLAIHTPS